MKVQYKNLQKDLKVLVSDKGGCDSLGRNWFKELQITVNDVNSADNTDPTSLFEQYKTVFIDKLGTFLGKAII